jgi:hypothetical protein
VKVAIEAPRAEGPVGAPLPLALRVDASELRSLGVPLQYRVSWNPLDWVVSGPVEGRLESSSETSAPSSEDTLIRIVAIPVRPGEIPEYPAVSLLYCPEAGAAGAHEASSSWHAPVENLSVVHQPPGPFVSKSEDVHAAVASPWPPAAAARTSAVYEV